MAEEASMMLGGREERKWENSRSCWPSVGGSNLSTKKSQPAVTSLQGPRRRSLIEEGTVEFVEEGVKVKMKKVEIGSYDAQARTNISGFVVFHSWPPSSLLPLTEPLFTIPWPRAHVPDQLLSYLE